MDGDSEIRNILPQFPVVDRVGQINPRAQEGQKRKLRTGAAENKDRKKGPGRTQEKEDTDEEQVLGTSDRPLQGENRSPADTPHEPGEKIDLVI